MATAYVYNGFGKYETNEAGVTGITTTCGGYNFWFPFGKVTPIPDFTFNVVDHDKSTPSTGSEAELTYMADIVKGNVVAELMLKRGLNGSYDDRGLMVIEGRRLSSTVNVVSGSSNGELLYSEVTERIATEAEIREAEKRAKLYKETVIKEFFQSKRERMSGGPGRLIPDPTTRMFMEELGVEDNEDVTAHAKNGGMTPEFIAQLIAGIMQSNNAALQDAVTGAVKRRFRGPKNDLTVAPLSDEEKLRRLEIGRKLAEGRARKRDEREQATATAAETVGA